MVYILTDNFFQTNVINYDYKDLKDLKEEQAHFLNEVINSLTNRNPNLRNIKLIELIEDIKKIFKINYNYDLVEERGKLIFKTKIVGRDKEIDKILEVDQNVINRNEYKN